MTASTANMAMTVSSSPAVTAPSPAAATTSSRSAISGFALIDGGAGDDRLVLGPARSASTLPPRWRRDGWPISRRSRWPRSSVSVVRAGDVNGLAGGGEALRLYTAAELQVELIGGWVELAGVVVDGQLFHRFTLAARRPW